METGEPILRPDLVDSQIGSLNVGANESADRLFWLNRSNRSVAMRQDDTDHEADSSEKAHNDYWCS